MTRPPSQVRASAPPNRTEVLAAVFARAGERKVFAYRSTDGKGGVLRSPDSLRVFHWGTGRESVAAAECDRVEIEGEEWQKLPLAGGA